MNATPDQFERILCVTCQNVNKHVIVQKAVEHGDPDIYMFTTEFQILKCMGCETHSYKTYSVDYENLEHDHDGELVASTSEVLYPPREKLTIRTDMYSVPKIIRKIFEESINAFHSKSFILCGIGLRATAEAMAKEKKIKGRDLEAKIKNLKKDGYITEADEGRLHGVRFLGNDAAHNFEARKEACAAAMLVIDHLLSSIYSINESIAGALDQPIRDYDAFISLVHENLTDFSPGSQISMTAILGKDKRRVIDKFSEFESRIIQEIKDGKFTKLKYIGLQRAEGGQNSEFFEPTEPAPKE